MKTRLMSMNIRSEIIPVILCLLMAACSRDKNATAPGTAPSLLIPAASVTGNLSVRLLPENPTANTDLQAIVTTAGSNQVSYQWEQNGRMLAGENASHLSPKNRFAKGDRIVVTVSAEGRSLSSAPLEIKNSLPIVTSLNLSPEIIYRGIDITAVPSSADLDGDYVRYNYAWSINGEISGNSTAVLSGDKFKSGDRISVTVIPFDSEGEGAPFVSRPITIPGSPPKFVSTPPLDFKGVTYTYQAEAETMDRSEITYSLASSPQGMSIDPKTGMITLQIKKEHAGTHNIEIVAKEPGGQKTSQKYSLTLTIP